MKKLTQRNTKQKRIILEELQQLHSHPSASQLYEKVKKRIPNISLGTVYRNLDLLVKNGVIQKIENGCAETRYDGDLSPHIHLQCTSCGTIDDLPFDTEKLLKKEIEDVHGYDIQAMRLELKGLCPDCQSKKT